MNNLSQIHRSLQLVKLEGDIALIDSRVFCSEVLLVDHADWLADTLKPNKTEIEVRFGHLRFQTGDGIKRPQGGGKQEVYALLTEAQCNACLVLSRNLRRTIALKLDLVADFERAKALVKEYFEQKLTEAIALADKNQHPRLAGMPEDEIYRLADEYLQIREVAAKQYPTLIKIFDELALPQEISTATRQFAVKGWLAENGYKLTQRQYRHLCRAIGDCHRFLTVTPPRQIAGVNYYTNQHEPLLRILADNTLKLVRLTSPFVC